MQVFYIIFWYIDIVERQKDIGIRLKESRKNAGYTQKQVAEQLGMKQPNYAKYEAGTIELDYEKLIFLCKLFHVSSDYLLGLDEF